MVAQSQRSLVVARSLAARAVVAKPQSLRAPQVAAYGTVRGVPRSAYTLGLVTIAKSPRAAFAKTMVWDVRVCRAPSTDTDAVVCTAIASTWSTCKHADPRRRRAAPPRTTNFGALLDDRMNRVDAGATSRCVVKRFYIAASLYRGTT